ncbi:MAG: hypothetical protein WBD10_05650 [Acidobacteriaceae bacterium]
MSSDPLQYFSLWIYISAAVFYSAVTLGGALRKGDAQVFSKQNAKPLSAILVVHFEFLTVLLGLMWIVPLVYSYLPSWITDTYRFRGATISNLELLFCFATGVMYLIERRHIYAKTKIDEPSGLHSLE